jgi:tocopherol O-methyltransferase
MDTQTIAHWYDESTLLYKLFWYRNSDSFALHYGLWDPQTTSMGEALSNTNAFMAAQAHITSSSRVLDAGCGIGGSAMWLAKHTGASVTGINISHTQIRKAQALAQAKNVASLVTFSLADYVQTAFPNETFDVVWALESVCHAEKKEAFLAEAYRLLKRGGRVIVADGFLRRTPKTSHEHQLVADFYTGMLLPNLSTFEQFETAMKQAGFKNITAFDKTKEIVPSSKRLAVICRVMMPLIVLAAKMHWIPEIFIAGCKAGMVQYEAVLLGVGGYGIMYGEKE